MEIQPGDQLFIHGPADQLGAFIANARLLEIGRLDTPPVETSRAIAIIGIFAAAIVGIVAFDLSPAIAFFAAAVILAATRLIPSTEVYRSIDWPVVVLLAAMIPVGQSLESTGAVAIMSEQLSSWLGGTSVFFTFVAIGAATLLLSALLNNVATAIIMGPLVLQMSEYMGFSPDAGLIMVLIAASSDFLTPIGHQNNLLVMAPGGYRFSDYARMGIGVSIIVIGVAAWLLSIGFG
ncbi:SLC13 family permease [Sphingosinicella soli]|uniref:Di/tricarboxylate transporter n=1 Tax=Sphingosinicella soli TaxID=333708 RepID=A0A7W7F7J9_9SPHN|nr:SLC13 family permease [Sphingosinicella soli]MBB4632764.1 di/tricarboxylate transporter [Sphingosinicella soli]